MPSCLILDNVHSVDVQSVIPCSLSNPLSPIMRFFLHAAALLPLLHGAVTENLVLPQVDSMVKSFMAEYASSSHNSGPAGAKLALAASHHEKRDVESRATEYWLETIKHQGISAFGPSGYKVYRNVITDFGAKGI